MSGGNYKIIMELTGIKIDVVDPVVNFTNILRAAFIPILLQKLT
jgi:hypothetical protein